MSDCEQLSRVLNGIGIYCNTRSGPQKNRPRLGKNGIQQMDDRRVPVPATIWRGYGIPPGKFPVTRLRPGEHSTTSPLTVYSGTVVEQSRVLQLEHLISAGIIMAPGALDLSVSRLARPVHFALITPNVFTA